MSGTAVLKCTVSQVFDTLFADDAPLPFDKFQEERIPSKDRQLSKWIKGSEPQPYAAIIARAFQLDPSDILMSRQYQATIQTFRTGQLTKVQMVVHKDKTLIKMRMVNSILGVPSSDCFNPEEEWVITSTDPDCPKCIVRQSLYIHFHKSSFMQSMITGKAFDG